MFKLRYTQKEAQLIHSREIASLREEISSFKERNIETIEVEIPFEYTIKKGDSFYLISKKMYGTEKFAQDIADANKMDFTSKLIIGYKIKIPQK